MLSLMTQKTDITNRIGSGQWSAAESRLRDLAGDKDYLHMQRLLRRKIKRSRSSMPIFSRE